MVLTLLCFHLMIDWLIINGRPSGDLRVAKLEPSVGKYEDCLFNPNSSIYSIS